jgi:DNA-binding XRE family transcriptional regulator
LIVKVGEFIDAPGPELDLKGLPQISGTLSGTWTPDGSLFNGSDFALAFRVFRASRGWTQLETARAMGGVRESMISLIESGKRQPSLETLQRAAAAFDVPLHLFVALATGQAGDVAPAVLAALTRRKA